VLRNADVINSNLSRFGLNNECTAPCSETMRLLCFAPRIARFPLPSLRSEKICLCVCVCMCVRVRFLYRTIGEATRNQSGSDSLFEYSHSFSCFLSSAGKNSLQRVVPARPSRASVFAVCGNEF